MSARANQMRASYRRSCRESVTVRRYTGVGQARTHGDTTVKGRVGEYAPREISGSVQQGDRRAIVLAEDLPYAPSTADFVVVANRELKIMAPLPRKALDGTVIAYELQVRG